MVRVKYKYVNKAKSIGLSCGIVPEQKQIIVQENTKTSRIRDKYITFKNSVTKNWCMGNEKGTQVQIFNQTPILFQQQKDFLVNAGNMKKISFEKVKQHFSLGSGNKWICSLLLDGSILNQNLTVWFELAKDIV